jgi:rhodanese-related sulfurtransferase
MLIALPILAAVVLFLLFTLWRRRRERGELADHSITPQELNTLLSEKRPIKLFDVRLSLDLLAYSEIIPGAERLPPERIAELESSLPRDEDLVVYCTCISEKTSKKIIERALALKFTRIKLLKGGLEGWKANGFPVEPYTIPFHLDTNK